MNKKFTVCKQKQIQKQSKTLQLDHYVMSSSDAFPVYVFHINLFSCLPGCLSILSSSEFTCWLSDALASVIFFSSHQTPPLPVRSSDSSQEEASLLFIFLPVQKSMKNIACAWAYIENIHYAFSFYYIYRFPSFQTMQILHRSNWFSISTQGEITEL
jgi:hypothetical protein